MRRDLLADVSASLVSSFHDQRLVTQGWSLSPPEYHTGIWRWIEVNYRCNTLLWDEEDKARRTDVPDSEIAASKRRIDAYNQKRNDAVERLDEEILERLSGVARLPGARLSSETPGSMIDRLSILSLKAFHMRLQIERRDVHEDHIKSCIAKLNWLVEQRIDLQNCLDFLLTQATRGDAYFKVYRQFKMYNDPSLNPYLYL
jgi:hypothetical protein